MSTNTIESWENSFRKEVQVLRLASAEGNITFLSIHQAKTLEVAAAQAGSVYNSLAALDMNTMYDTSSAYQQLQEKTEAAVKDTESSCTEVKNSLQSLQDKGNSTQEDWQALISSEISKQKAASTKRWDDLEAFGIEKISQLPKDNQAAAAKTYTTGLSVVGNLSGIVINWLKDAVNKISEFFRKAWEKVKEFASKAAEWCSNAWNTVSGIFSQVHLSAAGFRADNAKYDHSSAAPITTNTLAIPGISYDQVKQLLDLLLQAGLQQNLVKVHSVPLLRNI